MIQEEKQLLLKDLCARLPYGVICRYDTVIPLLGDVLNYGPLQEIKNFGESFIVNGALCLYENIKPYLRPMSSMTEEEENELTSTAVLGGYNNSVFNSFVVVDWLDKHAFDYRGLIPMGLALEAPEGMYKF